MAHNNGMVPRSRKGRGVSDNAGKFQAAVGAAPSIASDPQMDPAYLATPVSELTGAQTAAFVPHRPARPEKSEGGKKFKLVSEYEPAGDQPTAIVELVKRVNALERDQVPRGVPGPRKIPHTGEVLQPTPPQ